MPKGRIALIALGALIAAAALLLISRGFSGSANAKNPAPAAAEDKAAGKGKAGDKTPPRWQSFLRPDEKTAPRRPLAHCAQGVTSPFDRLVVAVRAQPAAPGLRLEGVSLGARPVALLSGHAVREGDTVSGFRVLRIGRAAVTLAGPGGSRFDIVRRGPLAPEGERGDKG